MRSWGWNTHILFELTEDTMAYRRYKNPVLRENGYRIPDSLTANKYCDDILTERILDFIDSNKTRPFFAYYSMSLGHDPYSPTPDDSAFATWDPRQPGDTAYYASMMKYMDKKVGIILAKLRATGLAGNTIVIYAGDNGTPSTIVYNAHGAKNIRGEKSSTTEGGTHVPLIVYWPGHVQEGTVNDDLTDFTDFLPTFAQAGNLADLSAYGRLDGISFYPKILGKPGKKKLQLYCFYNPENENRDSLKIWVRDKTYKLYDSTGVGRSGYFYNIKKDAKEISPLKDSNLTAKEQSIKSNFKLILDTSYYWPACPGIMQPFKKNITSSAAILGALITSAGATQLFEAGTSYSSNKQVFLGSNRLRDSTVAVGKFSQQRTGLKPQTRYYYMVYAINQNLSHSTGATLDSFITLSRAPLKQPEQFIATIKDTIINLEWSSASFPEKGASKAGYLLIRSTAIPALIEQPNGNAPENAVQTGDIQLLSGDSLPLLTHVTIQVGSSFRAYTYNFLLIPYTWDGVHTATCNYLVKDAPTATVGNTLFALKTGRKGLGRRIP